jgi:sulfate adenylyltransferase subunit 1 (EFTu-like GTPase family)
VGRIEAGKLQKDQEIVFLPQSERTTITSVEMLWQDRTEASAGESIGITIEHPLFLERGAIACPTDDMPVMTNKIRANVFWMSKVPFKAGDTLQFKVATQEQPAKITIEKKIDSSTLETISDNPEEVLNNEVAQMLIETPEPVVVENFNDFQELGRFVLVRDMDVVAGGIITHTETE